MLSDIVKVKIEGKTLEVSRGTTLKEISKPFQDEFALPIILAKVDGRYKELCNTVNKDCSVEFVTLLDKQANRAYLSGLIYLVMYANKRLFRKNKLTVRHAIDKGIYITSTKKLSREDVTSLKKEMKEIVKLNLPIEKLTVNRMEAIEYFDSIGDASKVELLRYNTNTFVTLYKLGNMYNFFFSYMPVEVRVLERFDLKYLNEEGFVLLFQTPYMLEDIKSYVHHPKVFEVFDEYHEWMSIMNLDLVSKLNKVVSEGNSGDLIRITEAVQSNKLLNIARTIYDNKNRIKVVMIAGPSSSGKTTTCNKLSMYLRSFGLNPKGLSMDNYFVSRSINPRDEEGNYDFECIGAIDLKLFNKQVKAMINGEKVQTPLFDFVTGEPDYDAGEIIQLEDNDILIIEGIHALNPVLLDDIPAKNKFKIYISPFTCMNLDDQNRISTSDNRLLRRIIRDNVNRGNKVEDSLRTWDSVRKGEEANIFPYQDEADVLFNTALIYEIGVLKTYVEPLLYSVDINGPYYTEAKRLLNMLKLFLPIPSEDIPKDSLLREFIGGGCFRQ